MSSEELLAPRSKCIGHQDKHYPGSHFGVGKIIEFKKLYGFWRFEWAEHDGINWIDKTECDEFPHLFKPLAWWEERGEADMPEYIIGKHQGFDHYIKVIKWAVYSDNFITCVDGIFYYAKYSEPISETEYLNYINKTP